MELVCINCPRGCNLNVQEVNGQIEVSGNFCPRGKQYAIAEMTNPLRTVTSTVDIESSLYTRLPVITSAPVPKTMIMDVVKAMKNVKVVAPIKMGDVVIKDVCGLNIDIIASKSIDK